MTYADLSIKIGVALLLGSVLSIPIPQLRVVFHNIVISGSAGVVLIALGIILGTLGLG